MDDQVNRVLLDTYHRLFARYGPQHWWPAAEPFEVIIGAILTQSTAWVNVEKAIGNLRAAGALMPEPLRRMPLGEIAGLIYPSGYYNAKAKKLKALAQWLGDKFDDNLDVLFQQNTDDLREQLLAVYGIGDETADSIILYAAGKPVFVIDAYTRRFINRRGLAPPQNTYTAYQALFMSTLPNDARLFNEYHALIVRLAKDVCRRKPTCARCCLNTTGSHRPDEQHPCSLTFTSGLFSPIIP
jgi:endonuclease-3 related protein